MKRKVVSLVLALGVVLSLFAGLPLSASAANFTVEWPAAGAWTQGTPPAWAQNASDAEQAYTLQAIYDEFDYQASIGFDMGTMNGGLTAWGNMVNVWFENGDQTGNPWGQVGRRMGGIIAPYAGTAFSVKADASANYYGLIPLGNETVFSDAYGNVCRVQAVIGGQLIAKANADSTWGKIFFDSTNYVGKGAPTAVTTAFQKAYAYAAGGVTHGERLTLGYAAGAVQESDGIYYQEFWSTVSDGVLGNRHGVAYIVGDENGAYVIADELFSSWVTTWDSENDKFSKTGKPIGNAFGVDGVMYQAFEKGILCYSEESGATFGEVRDEDIWNYTIADGKATIGYSGTLDGSVVLPETLGGYPVTDIGFGAFASSPKLAAIVLPDGVTEIPRGAFGDCVNLRYVVLSESVTRIGYGAFSGCTRLAAIELPEHVTGIDAWAFYECEHLRSVVLPERLTDIGDHAFFECDSLPAITIPDSVTTIGGSAFLACRSLSRITVSANNPGYTSVDGVLFDKDQQTLLCYPAAKEGAAYTVPTSVLSIETDAFACCTSLSALTIPFDVMRIGDNAFQNCENLTIYGYAGSCAESYAKENDIPFTYLIDEHLTAAQVDAIIDAIGEITSLDQKPAVETARTAYDALSAEQKLAVTKLYVLIGAEEKIAQLERDVAIAAAVEAQIDALGAVASLEQKSDVEAARAAYDQLTAAQQALVSNSDVLAAAEETIANLERAARTAASTVDAQIDALGEITSLEQKGAVEQARKAYDALDVYAKAFVTKRDALMAAAEAIRALEEQAIKDAQDAAEIDARIVALGEITLEKKADVEAIRAAYEALGENAKAQVTKLERLTDAEATIVELEAAAALVAAAKNAAADVDEQILALGAVTPEKEKDVEAARAAYEALSADAKPYVTELDVLIAAEKTIAQQKSAAAVDRLIDALGTIISTNQKVNVVMVRNEYEELTDDEKAYVTLLDKLVAAENAIEALEAQAVADAQAAGKVDALIDALGEVTLENKPDVEAARAAYDKLTQAQKALVQKLNTLLTAESAIKALETVAAADAQAAGEVDALIDALGEVTLENKPDVEAARAAYDKLTQAQKALVQKLNTLLTAESAIEALETIAAIDAQAAGEVDALIDALGEVTLENKPDVEAARAAYDKLTQAQKALVQKLEVLTTAEETIAKLEEASKFTLGDVDFSGVVDVADIMKLKTLIMRGQWSDEELKLGDTDAGGKLDVGDIMAIKNIIMNA